MAGLRDFRTRAPERDLETSRKRRDGVRRSIRAALRDATRELAGLEHRLADAYLSSITAMDNSEPHGARSDEDEEVIVGFEDEAARANRRVAGLKTELATYAKLLADIPAEE